MSNPRETIFRGEDKSIGITILQDNGDPVDLNGFSAIQIFILDSSNDVVQKHQYPQYQDDGIINMTDPSNGELSIMLNRSVTKGMRLGPVSAEIKMRKSVPGFEDDDFDVISREEFGEIEESISKNIDLG